MDDDETAATGGNGAGPDRDRHRHSIYMTGVLARALTARLEEMARPGDDAGWWFTRSRRPDRPRDEHG